MSTTDFAVIANGGKQYKIHQGDIIALEKFSDASGAPASGAPTPDAPASGASTSGEGMQEIQLTEVLMIRDGDKVEIGTPLLEGKTIPARILEQRKDKKVLVFKKKRRKNYRRTQGHRQQHTVVEILPFTASGAQQKAAEKASAKPAAKPVAQAEAKVAVKAAAQEKPAAQEKAAAQPAVQKKDTQDGT